MPVAVTNTVWAHISEDLFEVLGALRKAIKAMAGGGDQLLFDVMVSNSLQDLELQAHVGPGDNMEPVITVMFVGED